ncbi:hypothetical protein TeGR_g10510 [Tetraparma gracilis]|uniref:Splicing factor 3B subunit 1 n=1 Tax=Tetraparma gracilis TaxID=2962635 RepID=A0ABQ6M7B9_9STRA|nr:hypothetical protein TeGR_g10510 [Tetraparma gracilis]
MPSTSSKISSARAARSSSSSSSAPAPPPDAKGGDSLTSARDLDADVFPGAAAEGGQGLAGGFGTEVMDLEEDDDYYTGGAAAGAAGGRGAPSRRAAAPDDDDDDIDVGTALPSASSGDAALSAEYLRERAAESGSGLDTSTVGERESDYQQRGRGRAERGDGSYGEVMRSQELDREAAENEEKARKIREEKGIKEGGPEGGPEGGEKPRRRRWDEPAAEDKPSAEAEKKPRRRRWDQTPAAADLASATPAAGGSKWDETPSAKPAKKSRWDATPAAAPAAGGAPALPDDPRAAAAAQELAYRNRPLSDQDLDDVLPSEGFKVLEVPEGYDPVVKAGRPDLLAATPAGVAATPGFLIPETPVNTIQEKEAYGIHLGQMGTVGNEGGDIPFIKSEDYQYFGKLMEEVDEDALSKEAIKERTIMLLLLKIKCGTPPQRKTAMRQITEKAKELGAGPLFSQILPLLMSPNLTDQERHLLVKVIDRVLYKLDDLVRPYVHKILVVIEPLLIDEDYYARVEGREIISNLAKAAGLATMISTMRPDIDNLDEYVRNTTARAFAVVATALGVANMIPFLKAVCRSKKSWQARHTGIKIIQQISILTGPGILPFLKEMVEIIAGALVDEQQKAIGFIIPLMEENHANHYTREVMPILIREFQSPDEEMKKIVLKVIQQCCGTSGVSAEYVKESVLPEFFKAFWIRRMALDRRNYKQVVETTEELANKCGAVEIISRIVDDLKDDSELYRRMVMEAITKIVDNLGLGEVDQRLEERLIDGVLYAFQEQSVDADIKDNMVMLDGFGQVVKALGTRCKPYLKQIAGTIKWRLNNKSSSVRMQAADLIRKIAVVMKACGEDQLMGHLGVVLYEYLGEEYPEVLGSILSGLEAIVNVIGMAKMTPPIRDLLPRLTPILRNRHEKVQESVVSLVGRIADRGAEHVHAKEWMRICFELLEMLKAPKKAIRRAAVSTFGYISRGIGPQDVLHTLLNNLKVQDRQNRVCTTVAIAIVAESCGPFTVLPAIMNEYRVAELNIQNGTLKALSFMMEYVGPMASDYIYAIAPMLEDALIDRDQVKRQTAMATIRHLALGVSHAGCEDACLHLLNFVWPNIFEESPHVKNACFEALDGIMVSVGPNIMLQYCLAGLFHPARRVRDVYWQIYNKLYIFASHSMVAAYPSLKGTSDLERGNAYEMDVMDVFI